MNSLLFFDYSCLFELSKASFLSNRVYPTHNMQSDSIFFYILPYLRMDDVIPRWIAACKSMEESTCRAVKYPLQRLQSLTNEILLHIFEYLYAYKFYQTFSWTKSSHRFSLVNLNLIERINIEHINDGKDIKTRDVDEWVRVIVMSIICRFQ